MAKRRLNDTAALVAEPFAHDQTHTVSVRKIDNGYLTSTSICDSRTGEYRHAENFTPTPPRITPPKVGRGNPAPDNGSPLRDCMDYMRDGD